MELKLPSLSSLTLVTASSNRTFMELKYYARYALTHDNSVLIVPLWN